ncbi:MAG: hypothetical protein MST07_04105 [Firmicutes bacterium]|nr:hypothetical protein [Bacillota bacterium]
MKNKGIFSVSPALIRENFKLCWYVPALAFLLYFFAGIFPIILNLSDMGSIARYVNNSLNNYNVVYPIYMAGIPLVAAMLMMSFFHKPAKALALHAQPYSRSKLFNSHVVSGWLMCIIPVVLTALLYLVFMRETLVYSTSELVMDSLFVTGSPVTDSHNIYTFSAVMSWLASSIGIITFFYGMYILAGSLTGNSAMHLLLSGLFFVIVPALLLIVATYCESYIEGFVSLPDWVSDVMRCFNPLIMIVTTGIETIVSAKTTLTYLVLGLVFIAAGGAAYRLAKLEKVGDSMIFRPVEEIITYLVVFVGMTVFGFFFQSFKSDSKAFLIIGMAIGTLITFFITKVVIARSVKIFNMKNFKSLGVYVVIAALFTAFTVFDITGISKRLPKLDQVESVSCEYMFAGYEMDSFASGSFQGLSDIGKLSSPYVINKVYELHKYVIENELYQQNDPFDYYFNSNITYRDDKVLAESVQFVYKYKNGSEFKRSFQFALDDKAAELINDIVTNSDYRAALTLSDKIDEKLYDNAYASIDCNGEPVIISDPDELKKIIEAYDEDVYNSNYIDIYNRIVSGEDVSAEDKMLSEKYCGVAIIFRNEDTENEAKEEAEIWFVVNEYHPAVWEYLSEAGYVS